MNRGSSKGTTLVRKRANVHERRDRRGRTFEERELEVFAYIVRYAIDHMGHMPTLRQASAALEIPGIASVNYAIKSLVAKDKLRYMDGLLVIPGSKFEWTEAVETENPVFDAVAVMDADEWGSELPEEEALNVMRPVFDVAAWMEKVEREARTGPTK